jgi:hypothetical protein
VNCFAWVNNGVIIFPVFDIFMQQKINKFLGKNQLIIIFIIVIGVLGRLMQHLPNVTLLISLCLFTGRVFSYQIALLSLLATLFISDISLALLFGYPIFGYWTLFTYTGFIAVSIVGSRIDCSWKVLPVYILSSSFGFWIWTNFGVWLTSNLYPNTLAGFIFCYTAALPFLRNSLIGDMVWGTIIFGVFDLFVVKVFGRIAAKSNRNYLYHS